MKNFLSQLHDKQAAVLAKIDQLYEAANNLHDEGKVSHSRNVHAIDEVIGFFHEELLFHIEMEEMIIFPFLKKHIPRLDPVIQFLHGDHQDFKESFSFFQKSFEQFKKDQDDAERRKVIEKLRDKATYLFCLMRSHIKMEADSIYKVCATELNKEEQKELLAYFEHPKI